MLTVDIEKILIGGSGKFKLNISFQMNQNEFLSLYGKSGSGKTTTLRLIAGLDTPDDGIIKMNDTIWYSKENKINIPPQNRNIGFLFQSYALFPNMTVYENISYGLKRGEKQHLDELLDIVELYSLKNRYPSTLSGGQQQRVAFARAVARKPNILLLDEPLSALDMSVREKLQNELLKLHKLFNLTTIIVSHDMQEVMKLADRTIYIDNGMVKKVGKPKDIFFGKTISSKFSFTGTVIDILKVDIIYLSFINVGEEIVQVALTENDIKTIKIGDKVLVASKAFNPIITPIELNH